MNWFILIIFGMAVTALIVFLVKRNIKDEKVFEDQLKNDFHKSKNEEGDVDTDEVLK